MQVQNKARLGAAIAVFATLVAFASPARAATLAEAQTAYRDNRVAEAERMFAAIAADGAASPADRAGALTELARVDWLVRGETDAAAGLMEQVPDSPERCAAAVLTLRIFREAGAPAQPLADAEASRGLCRPRDGEALRVQLARSRMALARAAPHQRAAHLAAAAAELEAIDAAAAGTPSVGAAQLSLALMRRDTAGAFAAWRDYYWLTDSDAPQAMPVYQGRARALFEAGLAANAAPADVRALAVMLARAGFIDDARLLVEETGAGANAGDDAAWVRTARFFAFVDTVRAATLRANREMATGGRGQWYQGEIEAAFAQLISDTQLSGDPDVAVTEAFGGYGSLGETGGYPSLHSGFLAEDRRIDVEQYGRRGALRFIVIDNMVTNGFESWLWDGWAQAGGWSDDNGIVQIRSAYTPGPLSALRLARPGPTRDRYIEEIARADAEESAALGRDGIGLLPATSDRLTLQAVDRLAQETGGDDATFIAAYWREEVHYSITLHEGRHALDVHEPRRLSAADREFRAKLSQIALSDYPRLGLSDVISGPLNDTPHGIANRRILVGYRAWMRRHREEVVGFDRAQPSLAQLHLMNDDQIRAAAASVDPWAPPPRCP